MMNSGFEENKKSGVTLFASGAGTNAENCMAYFKHHPAVYINLIVTNNPEAGVISGAKKFKIPYKIYSENDWKQPEKIALYLISLHTKLIVLAGYLKLIPAGFIKHFPHRIINIHPALLPKYGGKGMFGKNVHEKIMLNKEIETGFTVHEVDEIYDNGKILFQKKIPVEKNDTAQTIEKKVRALEYKYLPRVIEKIIREK